MRIFSSGTQEIFYRRGDVQTVNLHADTAIAYPFFSGRSDEIGRAVEGRDALLYWGHAH